MGVAIRVAGDRPGIGGAGRCRRHLVRPRRPDPCRVIEAAPPRRPGRRRSHERRAVRLAIGRQRRTRAGRARRDAELALFDRCRRGKRCSPCFRIWIEWRGRRSGPPTTRVFMAIGLAVRRMCIERRRPKATGVGHCDVNWRVAQDWATVSVPSRVRGGSKLWSG
jgi:hypothetical protein